MRITPKDVLIILPALNEAESLGGVINEIQQHSPGIDCLVVNDGSKDNTSLIALKSGAGLLELPFNIGVGGAMRAGFRYALAEGYSAVVQVDADGQHDPKNISELIAGLSSADLVIGARFAGKGNYQVKGLRKLAMKILSIVIGKISKTKLSDTTSGFRAIGPRALKVFSNNFPAEYLGDTVEALVIAARSNLIIIQVPVVMRPRQGGEPSQNTLKSAAYLFRVFIALFIAAIRPIDLKVGFDE